MDCQLAHIGLFANRDVRFLSCPLITDFYIKSKLSMSSKMILKMIVPVGMGGGALYDWCMWRFVVGLKCVLGLPYVVET